VRVLIILDFILCISTDALTEEEALGNFVFYIFVACFRRHISDIKCVKYIVWVFHY